MKKYLLAILALFILVGMSAFVIVKKSQPRTNTIKKTQTAYYWYNLGSNGKISGTVLNPGGTDIKANVIDGGTNELTDCSDQAMPYCIAGCSSSALHTGDTPDAPTFDLDNRVKSDN
jgi:hypothetical protein